jgi:hypothetical protein
LGGTRCASDASPYRGSSPDRGDFSNDTGAPGDAPDRCRFAMRSAIPPPSFRRRVSPMATEAVERCGPIEPDRQGTTPSRKAIVNAPLQIVGPHLAEPNPSTTQPTARAIAERLVASALPARSTPEAAAAGAEELFARLFHNLSQWVGSAGCQALFSRAFVLCAATHPVCAGVRYRTQGATPHLDRLAENARVCGGSATVEGITEVVTSIVTMLTGLIGDGEIAMGLMEGGPPAPHRATPRIVPDESPYRGDGAADGRHPQMDRSSGHHRRHDD